jgi:hypothetical protein
VHAGSAPSKRTGESPIVGEVSDSDGFLSARR